MRAYVSSNSTCVMYTTPKNTRHSKDQMATAHACVLCTGIPGLFNHTLCHAPSPLIGVGSNFSNAWMLRGRLPPSPLVIFVALWSASTMLLLFGELELELIQTRMIQKPLLWAEELAEVGKSACVLVGICELRLSLPARYDPHYPPLVGFLFLSGCLVRVLRPMDLSAVCLRQILHGMLNRSRPII